MSTTATAPATLKDVFLPYQWEFFSAPQRRKLWVSSRQIGKSFTIAACLVHKALSRPGVLSLCISTGARSASEIVKKCVRFAEAVQSLSHGSITFSASFDGVRFSNGSRVLSLPSTADALRGYTAACVAIDEAAYIDHLEDIMQAIAPTLTRDPSATLILASTPAGKESAFGKLFDKACTDPAWHVQKTSVHDAISAGLHVDLQALHELCPDPLVFAQEYECAWGKSSTAFVDTSLLAEATSDDVSNTPGESARRFLGVDVGRTHDRTAAVLGRTLGNTGNTLLVEDLTTLQNMPWKDQFTTLTSLIRKHPPHAGFIDATGIGSMLAEEVHSTCACVKPFTFTSSNKASLFEALRDAILRGSIKFTPHILQQVRDDLSRVKRVISTAGDVRYISAHDDTGHADTTSALVLLVHAWRTHPLSTSTPTAFARSSTFGSWTRRI